MFQLVHTWVVWIVWEVLNSALGQHVLLLTEFGHAPLVVHD